MVSELDYTVPLDFIVERQWQDKHLDFTVHNANKHTALPQ